MGYDSPIYTSRVNGRPFLFEEMGDEVLSPASGMCAGKTQNYKKVEENPKKIVDWTGDLYK